MNETSRFTAGQRIVLSGGHSQTGRHGEFVEPVTSSVARVKLDPKPAWRNQSNDIWLAHTDYIQAEAGDGPRLIKP